MGVLPDVQTSVPVRYPIGPPASKTDANFTQHLKRPGYYLYNNFKMGQIPTRPCQAHARCAALKPDTAPPADEPTCIADGPEQAALILDGSDEEVIVATVVA